MKDYYIEKRDKFTRIAVKENNKLVECYIEEENIEPQAGELYKGIVRNIIPAINSAFIDIGYDKNCFMYIDKKFNNKTVKKNEELIVEVLKEPIGDKGAKVTSAFTLPGRYVVLETLNKGISFSKKIEDKEFKHLVESSVKKPDSVGIMIRTNAQEVSLDVINKEIEKLYDIYAGVVKEAQYSMKPKLLYSGQGVVDRILRDSINEDSNKIFVDSLEYYQYIKEFLESTNLKIELKLHNEVRSLFAFYGLDREILALRNNRVNLKSGGYIVIDKTEGMYVIDVNSGKDIKESSLKNTAFNTNLEAAIEIGNQILLRNLSGIIIIDFIDMEDKVHKSKIYETLQKSFKDDKNKTIVYPFTELNLIQIARKRRGKQILEYIEESCYCCRGRGSRIRFNYLKELIKNDVNKIAADTGAKDIYIQIGRSYEKDIIEDTRKFADEIGAAGFGVYVNFIENMEYYKIEALIFQNHIEKLHKYKIYE